MRLRHLDGIRFFLFTGIFIAHIAPIVYGQLGYSLPMFFILSGFLVSYVLSGVFAKNSLKQVLIFYARRALRTLPSYFIFVSVLIAMGLTTYPFELVTLWYNIKIFMLSMNGQGEYENLLFNFRSESISLWSICVEEQFYFFVPIIYYFVRQSRHLHLTGVILTMSVSLKIYFILNHPHLAYGTLLPVALEPIGWGFMFFLLDRDGYLKKINANFAMHVCLALLIGLPLIEQHFRWDSPHYQFSPTLMHSVFCFFGGAFVWSLWRLDQNNWMVKLLGFRPFVYLGQISYGLYLTHLFSWPLYDKLLAAGWVQPQYAPYLVRYALTLVMGMILWHLVDGPVMKLRNYFKYEN